jgi:hypothetical protein
VPDVPAEDAVVGAGAAGVPSAPRNLIATQGATGVVTLDWDVPNSIGGSAITNYKIYKSTVAGGAGAYTEVTTNLVPVHPSTATSVVASSVVVGLTFFKVTAVNTQGESPQSAFASLTVV